MTSKYSKFKWNNGLQASVFKASVKTLFDYSFQPFSARKIAQSLENP